MIEMGRNMTGCRGPIVIQNTWGNYKTEYIIYSLFLTLYRPHGLSLSTAQNMPT